MNKNKKRLLILSSCLILLTTSKMSKDNYVNDYLLNEEYTIDSMLPFAMYNNSKVYIGNEEYIKEIRNDSTKDIYIIDKRSEKDSNISIVNSYEIRNPIEMEKIINILLEYERKYPSNWNRTKKSMLNEWIAHNICYDFDYRRGSTEQVDLNNQDEEKYKTF